MPTLSCPFRSIVPIPIPCLRSKRTESRWARGLSSPWASAGCPVLSRLPRTRASVSLLPGGKEALEQGTLSTEERQVAALLATRPHSPLFLQKKVQARNVPALLARMQKKDFVIVKKDLKLVSRRKKDELSAEPAQLELDFSLDDGLRKAARTILEAITKKIFSPFLLFGPAGRRGAGYFHLIREAVAGSGRGLYLAPELALSPALIE